MLGVDNVPICIDIKLGNLVKKMSIINDSLQFSKYQDFC